MTPRLLLEPEAELDLEGARIWYEERAKGLGAEFLRNVRATLAVIERQPELFPLVHRARPARERAPLSLRRVLRGRGRRHRGHRMPPHAPRPDDLAVTPLRPNLRL